MGANSTDLFSPADGGRSLKYPYARAKSGALITAVTVTVTNPKRMWDWEKPVCLIPFGLLKC